MEWLNRDNYLILLLLLPPLFLLFFSRRNVKDRLKQQPPGPSGWPVVGNMFELGTLPHLNLYKLRAKYGPVIWLRFGSTNTMVVQSAKSAAELFKNHDLSFSDRKVPDSVTALNHHEGSVAFARYGAYWRLVRRLCSKELLVNKRLSDTATLRQNCVDKMIGWIQDAARDSTAQGGSGEVQLGNFFFLMTFNLVGNLMFSRDLVDPHSEEGYEFFNAMKNVMLWAGKPNVSDFLPSLKWLDPQGIKKNMVRDLGQTLKIIARLVKERNQEIASSGRLNMKKDFLDVLIEHQGDGIEGDDKEGSERISEKNTKRVILEMFFGGTETTSIIIEWAMTELLRSPNSMKRAKEELDRVIGRNKNVEEKDIDELPYLQAVVKETLRLHPPVPLLLPRNTIQDTEFLEYLVPKNTQVFVNAWAIGRDEDAWNDPLCFKPERFLSSNNNNNIEYKGQHFELIPFGAGRRICLGYLLAHRVINLGLAGLIHSFDWELPSSITPEAIDMEEKFGLTLRKLIPLKAIPKSRCVRGSVQD